ncbi:MAG: HAMP domain-containing histidine kinase [Ruminococcus sp.]|nr:HAMP domain-containing histidine kinase [Ruminococcus sp.]
MKKLRRKIVFGVLLSATAVFLLTVLFVGISLNLRVARRADTMTLLIVENDGELPEKKDFKNRDALFDGDFFGNETLYRLRFFSVYFDDEGKHSDLSYIASIDSEKALSMAEKVRKNKDSVGYLDNYRYRVSEDGKLVVFLDNSDEVGSTRQLVLILSLVAVFFVLMITLVFWFLSKRIVRPFERNSKMQKQFITDASHELKTPLAIISANAEVLAFKDGENEWISNITSQVARVSELVDELLTLNRLEEVEEISGIESVNLSEKTNAALDSFAQVFSGKNAALSREIQPDVVLNGNPSQLERLISVLTENASKYVSENGEVKVSLKREPRFTRLTVYNTCEIDESVDYNQLFDRFYRPDSSRTSKTGGHGVGLSIAKRIVKLHSGSIEAIPSGDGLSFIVKLPNKLKERKRK